MARAAVRDVTPDLRAQGPSKGHLARAWSRLIRKKIAVACMVVLVVIYTVGLFAALIAPYSYTEPNFTAIREPPSWRHLAGTDFAGRDVLTRVMWSVQNTVVLTVASMVTGGLVIGLTLGLISGYFGKGIDAVIMRTGEVFAAFPGIFLVLILAATLGPRIDGWIRSLEDNYSVAGRPGADRDGRLPCDLRGVDLLRMDLDGAPGPGSDIGPEGDAAHRGGQGHRSLDPAHPLRSPASQRHQPHSRHRDHGHGDHDRH